MIFEGHVYARVFGETYRLDYVPVEISEDEAKTPMAEGIWLGYELAQAICRELQATVQSECALEYLKGGPCTEVMTKLQNVAERERSVCYRQLETLRGIATGLFHSG